MRHAPVFEEAASGLWTRGRNGLERARHQELRGIGIGTLISSKLSQDATRNATAPLTRLLKVNDRTLRFNGLHAARMRREKWQARLPTVAWSANVIAVSYQRTGSFQSDPVDTGRAFARTLLPNTLNMRHRACKDATCPKSP